MNNGSSHVRLLSAFDHEVGELAHLWRTFRELAKDEESVALAIQWAPDFFGTFQVLCVEAIRLRIAKLLDNDNSFGDESKANLTLSRLLAQCSDADRARLVTDYAVQFKLLDDLRKDVRDFRNWKDAHLDLSVAMRDGCKSLPKLEFGRLDDAVRAICHIARAIYISLTGIDTDYEAQIVAGGYDAVTKALRAADEWSIHQLAARIGRTPEEARAIRATYGPA